MRIAFCTFVSLSHYGGIEKWTIETAEMLMREGHAVEIHALPYTHGERRIELKNVSREIPYHEGLWHDIKADVAYLMYYSPIFWRVFFKLHCPRIAGLHPAGLLSKRSPRHFFFKTVGRFDLASFDAVHALNTAFAPRHKNLFLLPNWVNTSFFRPCIKKPDNFTILFVGRQRKEKGWDTFIRLSHDLKQRGNDFNFICTGRGNELINGLGFVKDKNMPEVYSGAHVVVCPSSADVFSLTILEALSCGTPVITTPTPAHVGMRLPLLFAKDVEGFIKEVSWIYTGWKENTGWYEKLCSSLRARVQQDYNVREIFPKLESMFRSTACS